MRPNSEKNQWLNFPIYLKNPIFSSCLVHCPHFWGKNSHGNKSKIIKVNNRAELVACEPKKNKARKNNVLQTLFKEQIMEELKHFIC